MLHNYAWFLCRGGQFAAADALFERAVALPQTVATSKALLARGCARSMGLFPEGGENAAQVVRAGSFQSCHGLQPGGGPVPSRRVEPASLYIRRVNDVPAQITASLCGWPSELKPNGQYVGSRRNWLISCAVVLAGSKEATALELGRFDG